VQIDFLIQRMKDELARNQEVLEDDSLDEFRQALEVYETLRDQLDAAQHPSLEND